MKDVDNLTVFSSGLERIRSWTSGVTGATEEMFGEIASGEF